MPLIKAGIYRGKSDEYCRAVLDGIHSALVDTLGIPDYNIIQELYEFDTSRFRRPGGRTVNYTMIEICLFSGRTHEQKKSLYQAIAGNLSRSPGINGNDVMVVLHESPMENWSVRDGLPADETGAR
jgi:phenylpyruvate tautomerase PptA (4-oxalocrotonate tautomerase family)